MSEQHVEDPLGNRTNDEAGEDAKDPFAASRTQASVPPDIHMADQANTHQHLVQIHVNNRLVDVLGPRTTGAAIKAAAIKAGLSIEPDFVLIEERPNGDDKTIGDNDPITVNQHSKFTAVAPDDNS